MTLRTLILIVLLGSLNVPAQAQQEFFPFLAEVTANKVNIRAGQSANFETLCRADRGDELIIEDSQYSWYKVRLKPNCYTYISAQFVQELTAASGGVIADRVNVRARPNTSASVVGQADAGTRVIIAGRIEAEVKDGVRDPKDEWLKIQPLDNMYGWISENFVAFKSKDIAGYRESAVVEETDEDIMMDEEPAAVQKEESLLAEFIMSTGILSKADSPGPADIEHVLLIKNQPAYYLEGFKHILDEYFDHTVKIEGEVNFKLKDQYAHPVVTVTKIELVL